MGRTVFRVRSGTSLTTAQRGEIVAARERALYFQTMVSADMNSIWSTRRRRRLARIAHFPKIRRWIGMQTKHRKVRRINRRTRKLRKWLDNRRIIIVFHDDDDFVCRDDRRGASRGARYISPVLRIHMCKRFFVSNDDERAGLFIHELCHEMGMLHVRSDARTSAQILALAASDSRERVNKLPGTYQGLMLEYSPHPR